MIHANRTLRFAAADAEQALYAAQKTALAAEVHLNRVRLAEAVYGLPCDAVVQVTDWSHDTDSNEQFEIDLTFVTSADPDFNGYDLTRPGSAKAGGRFTDTGTLATDWDIFSPDGAGALKSGVSVAKVTEWVNTHLR